MPMPIYRCARCKNECDEPEERFEAQHHPYGEAYAREVLVSISCPWCGSEELTEVKPAPEPEEAEESAESATAHEVAA